MYKKKGERRRREKKKEKKIIKKNIKLPSSEIIVGIYCNLY